MGRRATLWPIVAAPTPVKFRTRSLCPTGAPTAAPTSASRLGTAIARSKVPLRKWAIAIYLCLTSLKSVSSLKLHRDIGVSQPTAWFMLHRIREAWATENDGPFDGPVEVDETYIGGRKKNMSKAKRREIFGRGPAGKTMVMGAKDRATNRVVAQVIERKDGKTMQGFVGRPRGAGSQGLHRSGGRL